MHLSIKRAWVRVRHPSNQQHIPAAAGGSWGISIPDKINNPSSMFWVCPAVSYQLDMPRKPPKRSAQEASWSDTQTTIAPSNVNEQWVYTVLPLDVCGPYLICKSELSLPTVETHFGLLIFMISYHRWKLKHRLTAKSSKCRISFINGHVSAAPSKNPLCRGGGVCASPGPWLPG